MISHFIFVSVQSYDPFIEAILENLEKRFEDKGMLKNFSIFDPMTLQEDGDEVLDEDQIESLEVGTCSIETINSGTHLYSIVFAQSIIISSYVYK